MGHESQWLDLRMSVRFSRDHGSWTYTCLLGCFRADYEGEGEALAAFLAHECES